MQQEGFAASIARVALIDGSRQCAQKNFGFPKRIGSNGKETRGHSSSSIAHRDCSTPAAGFMRQGDNSLDS